MQFSSLADTGLGIRREECSALFAPFVQQSFTETDPVWCAEIEKRQRKILRMYLRRVLLGWLPAYQRRTETILDEYIKAWDAGEYANYSLQAPLTRLSPWRDGERCLFASDVGATRVRQLLLVRLIERLRPGGVLEVGCGNGINLMLLAGRFPDMQFAGLELTSQGHRSATSMQQHAELPTHIQEYAPLPLQDSAAFRRIRFVQGSAAELPFADGEFDLVITILALEQMEQIRQRALSEVARVARHHVFNIEPFRDVNNGWAGRNVVRRNYFRGSIEEMRRYGLEPEIATTDFPQEAFLKACAVLSVKR